jgi:hypothetical protein
MTCDCTKDYCECFKQYLKEKKYLKVDRNIDKFSQLVNRFSLTNIEYPNTNLVKFRCRNTDYYLGLSQFKIRVAGSNQWSKSVIKELSNSK